MQQTLVPARKKEPGIFAGTLSGKLPSDEVDYVIEADCTGESSQKNSKRYRITGRKKNRKDDDGSYLRNEKNSRVGNLYAGRAEAGIGTRTRRN